MLDIALGEMATISDRFTKKTREFLHRIADISQDSDIAHQIPSEMTDSESKSKPKGNNRITQALTSCRQTRAMHPQVREIRNFEIVEHRIASEDDEEDDEHLDDGLESEQIMVPSDPSKWNSSHINEWISWCSRTFTIKPGSIAAILPSTGKELLRLTLQDWQDIGGMGGSILARHLAHLRLQATGVYTPGLQDQEWGREGLK